MPRKRRVRSTKKRLHRSKVSRSKSKRRGGRRRRSTAWSGMGGSNLFGGTDSGNKYDYAGGRQQNDLNDFDYDYFGNGGKDYFYDGGDSSGGDDEFNSGAGPVGSQMGRTWNNAKRIASNQLGKVANRVNNHIEDRLNNPQSSMLSSSCPCK